jgi:hypothetical protein
VTFAPRHATSGGLPQSAAFVIDVPNQDKDAEQTLLLSGRCFDRAAYAQPLLPSEEIGEHSPFAVDSSLVLGDPASVADGQGDEMLTLVFPSSAPAAQMGGAGVAAPATSLAASARGATAGSSSTAAAAAADAGLVKELVLCCIDRREHGLPAGASQPPTNFAVTVPPTIVSRSAGARPRPHFFSVEAATGSVAPGTRTVLRFRFTPPKEEAGSAGAREASPPRPSGLPGPLSVGEWQTLDVTVRLSEGYVCEGAPATKTVVVRLRGYVPPMSKRR